MRWIGRNDQLDNCRGLDELEFEKKCESIWIKIEWVMAIQNEESVWFWYWKINLEIDFETWCCIMKFEHEIERIKERILHENDIGHVYYIMVNLHVRFVRKSFEEMAIETYNYPKWSIKRVPWHCIVSSHCIHDIVALFEPCRLLIAQYCVWCI